MERYQNTKIYKICSKDENIKDFYIGHTIKKIITRFQEHKSRSKKNQHIYFYNFVLNNGGWDNFIIILIEEFQCQTNYEARQRELYYYELLKPSLNKNCPLTTEEEKKKKYEDYYQNNKEKMLKLNKEYRLKNSEKLKEYRKDLLLRKKILKEINMTPLIVV